MSISFSTPLRGMTSVGLGAGDIAVLFGAGRAAGNWLKAKYLDQSLRDVVNAEKLIKRKGVVDPSELHRRWSNEMNLFTNGRILPLQTQDVRKILSKTDYDHFTWLMTLVTASLTAATSESCKSWVIAEVLSCCIEHDEAKVYLEYDIGRNIESWYSIATTRKIVEAARRSWETLAYSGIHRPGLIPNAENHELKRFFLWLFGVGDLGPQSREFRTASTDVIALAMVLNDIGLTVLLTGNSQDVVLESQLVVIFDEASVAYKPAEPQPKRRGMRINMTNPEEVISLWPGDSTKNSRRKQIFLSAFKSVGGISVRAGQLISGETASGTDFQPLFVFEYAKARRLSGPASNFFAEFFIVPSEPASIALSELVNSWMLSRPACRHIIDTVIRLDTASHESEYVADLQVFTLGYYYGLLHPLIDVSRMSVVEAFASWAWNDLELFQLLRPARKLHGNRTIMREAVNTSRLVEHYERNFILKIVAYLFAGVEMEQVRQVRRSCCGIKGKLVLLDRVLLGDADDATKICQFALLDIDGTCLPSNVQGLLKSEKNRKPRPTIFQPKEAVELSQIVLLPNEPDFTSLIEPHWGFDLDKCVVAYRHHGRIVHRADPEALYNAILGASPVSDIYHGEEGQFRQTIEPSLTRDSSTTDPLNAISVSVEEFYDETLPIVSVGIGPESEPLCVATNSLHKIRSCITAIYSTEATETFHLANLRQRPAGCDDRALIVNLDSGQVIIK